MFVLNCVCVCVYRSFVDSITKKRMADIAPVRDKKFVRNCGLNPEGEKLFG